MSIAVMTANEDLNEAEQQMKDLEKKRIDKMKELEVIDAGEMLKNAGKGFQIRQVCTTKRSSYSALQRNSTFWHFPLKNGRFRTQK